MDKKDTFYRAVVSRVNKYSIVVRRQLDNKDVELYFSRFSSIPDSEKNKILESLAPNDIIVFSGKESNGKWYIDNVKKIIKSEEQKQRIQAQTQPTQSAEKTNISRNQLTEKANMSVNQQNQQAQTQQQLQQQQMTKEQITKDNYWEKKLEIDIEKLNLELERLSQERQNRIEMRRMSAFNRATEIIAMKESKNATSLELLEQVRLLAKQIEHDIINGIDIEQGVIPEIKELYSNINNNIDDVMDNNIDIDDAMNDNIDENNEFELETEEKQEDCQNDFSL